jgi:hypothetical protein
MDTNQLHQLLTFLFKVWIASIILIIATVVAFYKAARSSWTCMIGIHNETENRTVKKEGNFLSVCKNCKCSIFLDKNGSWYKYGP